MFVLADRVVVAEVAEASQTESRLTHRLMMTRMEVQMSPEVLVSLPAGCPSAPPSVPVDHDLLPARRPLSSAVLEVYLSIWDRRRVEWIGSP